MTEISRPRLKKVQAPDRVKKSLRGAFHLYKPEKLPTILSDEQMRSTYSEIPEDKRIGWSKHTLYTYEQAESRRAYRQAHVLKHWDERDREILFMLVLGWTHTEIGEILRISRTAVWKRVNAMLKKAGMETDTQLVLWFLGFIVLRPDNRKSVPGTTLIESCDELQKLINRRYHRHTS